jgi:hypothetical protein
VNNFDSIRSSKNVATHAYLNYVNDYNWLSII